MRAGTTGDGEGGVVLVFPGAGPAGDDRPRGRSRRLVESIMDGFETLGRSMAGRPRTGTAEHGGGEHGVETVPAGCATCGGPLPAGRRPGDRPPPEGPVAG